MVSIYELPGFDGFVDCYDAIGAIFRLDRESGIRVELTIRKGLPEDYTVSQMQLKYDHPYWEEFFCHIIEIVKNHVPNAFKDINLLCKD